MNANSVNERILKPTVLQVCNRATVQVPINTTSIISYAFHFAVPDKKVC